MRTGPAAEAELFLTTRRAPRDWGAAAAAHRDACRVKAAGTERVSSLLRDVASTATRRTTRHRSPARASRCASLLPGGMEHRRGCVQVSRSSRRNSCTCASTPLIPGGSMPWMCDDACRRRVLQTRSTRRHPTRAPTRVADRQGSRLLRGPMWVRIPPLVPSARSSVRRERTATNREVAGSKPAGRTNLQARRTSAHDRAPAPEGRTRRRSSQLSSTSAGWRHRAP